MFTTPLNHTGCRSHLGGNVVSFMAAGFDFGCVLISVLMHVSAGFGHDAHLACCFVFFHHTALMESLARRFNIEVAVAGNVIRGRAVRCRRAYSKSPVSGILIPVWPREFCACICSAWWVWALRGWKFVLGPSFSS